MNQPAAQIAKAKATAMDIQTIRESFPQFKTAEQFVAMQSPTGGNPSHVNEAEEWLRHGADEVLRIRKTESISDVLKPRIRAGWR
jgi:hypothetical protein